MNAPMEVLIIDDDELDRIAMIRDMKQSTVPVNFSQAATAERGLELAENQRFDVILLDFRLPDCDGIEVLKTLRNANSSQTTILMLSNQDDEALVERAINAGVQDFLLKSELNARRLLRAVHKARYRHIVDEQLSRNRKELSYLAEHDPLTGLANRYDFERALKLAIGRAHRGGSLAVLLLDLDKFKQVNDTYGHLIGDQLLIAVASRLQCVIRGSDLLARLGGDEFVVLINNMVRDTQAMHLAERILAAFKEPVVFGENSWTVGTSIGIAVFGDLANNATDLMKCADIAMYRSKQEGRNQYHFYSDQLHQVVRQRSKLEHDIRDALPSNQFKIFYQPQINPLTGKLGGLEALLRWEHPTAGLLLPSEFLLMAEEMGLMGEIGQWVMSTACTQFHRWRKHLPLDNFHLAVAVNVSAFQLQGNNLLEAVENALAESALDASCLELEITENTLIRDPERFAAMLSSIAARGVRLSLDDFGTGYSSFEHLKLFPIHGLKIDRSFIRGVGQGEDQDRLLVAIIRFARALNLMVVAEGIETDEQARFCSEHGCDLLQGFYYSPALSAEEFEATILLENI